MLHLHIALHFTYYLEMHLQVRVSNLFFYLFKLVKCIAFIECFNNGTKQKKTSIFLMF